MRSGSRLTFVALLALGIAVLATPVSAQDCPPDFRPAIHASVQPAVPCDNDEVSLVFHSCEPCTEIQGVTRGSSGEIKVLVVMRPEECVLTVCEPGSLAVSLGYFAAGEHEVRYDWQLTVMGDSVECVTTGSDAVRFTVSPVCPAPPPNQLPYLKHVIIGERHTTGIVPSVCANDSFPVRLIGEFPDDCTTLAGVELITLPTFGFAAAPPLIRIKYTSGDCLGRPCIAEPVRWEKILWLPGLPRGTHYQLPLDAYVVSDVCPVPGDSLFLGMIQRAFIVVDDCSTNTTMCLDPSWQIGLTRNDRCDAFLDEDGKAAVTLKLGTSVALAGLEGDINLYPGALQIIDIEPVGPAAGMNLGWQPTPDGASFVMFAKEGAPIPGGTLPHHLRVPILRVTVAAGDATIPPPPRTVITVGRLLGATEEGRGVPRCPTPAVIEPDDQAFICVARLCDFDGNGVADVRDLVRMVRCIRGEGSCPADVLRFDCNGDTVFDIDDVFCCARVILRGSPGEPGDGTRDESIRVSLGEPVENGDLYGVPLRLDSGTALGGTQLRLRFPADRFELVGVSSGDLSQDGWLLIHEVDGDEVTIGAVAIGAAGVPPALDLELRLRPGQTAAGSITLVDAEFADAEGAALIADLGDVQTSLGAGTFALSPGNPNPFSTSTRFSVTLPARGDLRVGVFDLSGRRIALLHEGPATAGTHEFRWDGRDGSGSQVRGGVYFVRARSAGELLTRKAIYLGGR